MLGGIGPTELIIVLFIILIVFGAGRLPDLASGLGKGVRNFKTEMRDLKEIGSADPHNPQREGRTLPTKRPAEVKKRNRA